jgi:hypothetical protein
MSINISAFAGAGAQFFDANGAPLTGGLLYTYAAGTTTNAVTYTSRTGTSNNTNPIVLDAAGRTPAEIWMTGGSLYKFVLKDSTNVQIGSYDNIPAINDVTTINSLITVAGTNTLTGLATPLLAAYTAGAQFSFVAQNTNTAAVTLDIDTLGAKSVTKYGTTALVAGDLVAGSIALIEYDGTRFQLINPVPSNKLTTSIKTSAFAAVSANTYAVNTTSAAVTATLPASPTAGDYITFTDYARTFGTYNLTLAPNGNKINASTSNVVLNVSGEAVSIVYIDATQGWLAYSGFTSNPTTNYSANYLVVAGGGGGGATAGGGGGGAGGLLAGSVSLVASTAYTITIGSGGAGSSVNTATGTNGTNSSISAIATAIAGGGGGANSTNNNGLSGGSGGGGSNTSSVGGAATSGQGYAGGGGASGPTGAGGGGAGAVGANAAGSNGGNGGVGATSTISGASVYYAGGGGGGGTVQGSGGLGGGGNAGGPGVNGTANTGGGGGGGGTPGGNGGSGVVIIAYLGSQRGTGGTVTTSGGYTIHTFTSSSTYNA